MLMFGRVGKIYAAHEGPVTLKKTPGTIVLPRRSRTTRRETKLNRESLYKMLSERGNPELKSLDALLPL
jgi:hypothetical protein